MLPYTRRRLGGRQPLCGIGVTSRIDLISTPAAWSARIADSRPLPAPGALPRDVERAQPGALRRRSAGRGGLLGGERRPLARALEAQGAGARPGHDVALEVRDLNVSIVEGGVAVGAPVHPVPLLLLALLGADDLCHLALLNLRGGLGTDHGAARALA